MQSLTHQNTPTYLKHPSQIFRRSEASSQTESRPGIQFLCTKQTEHSFSFPRHPSRLSPQIQIPLTFLRDAPPSIIHPSTTTLLSPPLNKARVPTMTSLKHASHPPPSKPASLLPRTPPPSPPTDPISAPNSPTHPCRSAHTYRTSRAISRARIS